MRKLKLEELQRDSVNQYRSSAKIPLVIVLDDIRSLNNIGSIFRTSDAFRVEMIHLCGITACPPHRDIHKTALGATDSVSWKYFDNVTDSVKLLKRQGYTITGVEQTSDSVDIGNMDIKRKDKLALILGNEVKGINDQILEMLDIAIEIPQYGTKHSLNVSVCAGIAIWEVFKKLKIHIVE